MVETLSLLAAYDRPSIDYLSLGTGRRQTDLDILARFGYFPAPHFYREPIATEHLSASGETDGF